MRPTQRCLADHGSPSSGTGSVVDVFGSGTESAVEVFGSGSDRSQEKWGSELMFIDSSTWFTTESEELTVGCDEIVTDNGTGIDGNMVLSNGDMKGEEITGGIDDGNEEVLSNGGTKGEVITGGVDGNGLINGLRGRG